MSLPTQAARSDRWAMRWRSRPRQQGRLSVCVQLFASLVKSTSDFLGIGLLGQPRQRMRSGSVGVLFENVLDQSAQGGDFARRDPRRQRSDP